jgi:hypothetical protein
VICGFSVLGSRFSVLGSQFSVLGSRFVELKADRETDDSRIASATNGELRTENRELRTEN